jgi:hypothetical protein
VLAPPFATDHRGHRVSSLVLAITRLLSPSVPNYRYPYNYTHNKINIEKNKIIYNLEHNEQPSANYTGNATTRKRHRRD